MAMGCQEWAGSDHETWILVREGKVQRLGGVRVGDKSGKVWPVAETREDAMKLVKCFGEGTTAALIGSAPGETLESHIEMAIDEGCIAIVSPRGWNEDGSPIWGLIEFN